MRRFDDVYTPGQDDGEPEWVRQILARCNALDLTQRAGRLRQFAAHRPSTGVVQVHGLGYSTPRTIEPWVFRRSIDTLTMWCPHLLGSDTWHTHRVEHAERTIAYLENALSNLDDPQPIVATINKLRNRLAAAEPESLQWAKARLALHAAEQRLARIDTRETVSSSNEQLTQAHQRHAEILTGIQNETFARAALCLGQPEPKTFGGHVTYPEVKQ